jgi:isochorismate pyruvate lyase
VHQAGRSKTTTADVRAPDRIEQVVDRVRSLATELGATPAVVERTYRAMIVAFIDVELATFSSGGSEEAERTS